MAALKLNLDRFLGFFDVPAAPLVGLDISSSSIKLVELSRKRNGQLVLEGYAIEPLPKNAFTEGSVTSPELFGPALEKAAKRLTGRTKNVAVALPATVTISKKVNFSNALIDEQMEEEIMVEANNVLPFPVEEVNLDWRILGPSLATPEQDNEVLICATRKERILDYQAAAEAGGFKVIVADIENYAQQRAFCMLSRHDGLPAFEGVGALVDAGSSVTNLHIFSNGSLIFSKDIPYGMMQLTEGIANAYGISMDEADDARRKNGEGLENYQDAALNPFLGALGLEINRTLQFFLTQATVERIDSIALAGGCAALPGSDTFVADTTQVPTVIANPFAFMEISSRAKRGQLDREAPLLLTACGLALRRFEGKQ